MAHDHHHPVDRNTYYMEQLATIAVCGALAAVTCLWYWNGMFFIADRYHLLVLGGGLGLLALVVIRAVGVWVSVDDPSTLPVQENEPDHDHEHEHAHGHEHNHDHNHNHNHEGAACRGHDHAHGHHHHHHGHDHDHAHGWAPWRYVVLLLPVVLYGFGLPDRRGFSNLQGLGQSIGSMEVKDNGAGGGGELGEVSFSQLERASRNPESRALYEGSFVHLVGRFVGHDDKRFSLTRLRMSCCATDAVPLNAAIFVDPRSPVKLQPQQYQGQWVDVRGRVQFIKPQGYPEYIPALVVPAKDEKELQENLRIVTQPANPFVMQ
jgi:hypothetical protein